MPRRPLGQDGSIRRLKRKHGFVWRVDVYDPWGRRIRRDFPDRATAEAFLAEIRRQKVLAKLGVRPEKAAEGTITLRDLASKYLFWAKGSLAESTVSRQVYYIRKIVEMWGDYKLAELPAEEISRHLAQVRREKSSRTANEYVKILRRMFNLAVEWGYVPEPPIRLKPFPEPKGRVRYLTREEAQRLLGACEGKLKTLVMLALYAGLRAGEIFRLRWEDIDWERKLLRVRPGKTYAERWVPIPDPLLEHLRNLKGDSGPVLKRWDYRKAWRNALAKAGIRDFRFHDLRHTYASWRVMAGVDLRTLAELLGHRTLNMVMRYAHLAPEHLERVRNLGMVTDWSPRERKD